MHATANKPEIHKCFHLVNPILPIHDQESGGPSKRYKRLEEKGLQFLSSSLRPDRGGVIEDSERKMAGA
jgi:hypothetical protein